MMTDAINQNQLQGALQVRKISELKAMPTIDAPGKTVGEILPAKRTRRGYDEHVDQVRTNPEAQPPVRIKDGVFQDGHHRLAAFEDAGYRYVSVLEERGTGSA